MPGSIATPITATATEITKIVMLMGKVRDDKLLDGDPEPVVFDVVLFVLFVVVFAGGSEWFAFPRKLVKSAA
jgi:hypothetical protein